VNIRYVFVFIAFFVLGGCGTAPPAPPTQRNVLTTSDTDADPRGRARIHTDLASSYLEIRNLGVALEEAGIAQRADPSFAPAYNVAGLIYIEMQDDRMAEESFRQALRIDPRDADTNNNYGTFLCQRKREADGIKHFLLAISDPLYRFPDRSFVNAGVCARKRGDLEGAQNYFRNALKFQADQPQALFQLAEISYAAARYGEARSYLTRLQPFAAGSPEILWLSIRTERRVGGGNSLESLVHQLRTNFPNSKEAELLAARQFD
jgi:type IV pilus assembly protein PilF